MVVTSPLQTNNVSSQESERRRKQTAEKARLTQLSRQLQMRLRYAKLKVDHGWQKQNLNEVENLYFHHSHQQGPSSPFTALPNQPPRTHSNSATPVSPRASVLLGIDAPVADLSSTRTNANENVPSNTSQPLPIPTTPAINPAEMSNLIQMPAESKDKLSSTSGLPRSQYQPPPPAGPSYKPDHSTTTHPVSPLSSLVYDRSKAPTSIVSTPWVATGSRPPPLPSSSQYSLSTLQRVPTLPASPGSNDNSFNYPGVSLTYDSFWSSHSSSASARSIRASLSTISSNATSDNSSMNDTFALKSYQAPLTERRSE